MIAPEKSLSKTRLNINFIANKGSSKGYESRTVTSRDQ